MLFDSHCHLADSRYGKTPEDVVKEAQDGGVSNVINIGTDLKDSETSSNLSSKIDCVYSTVGIYPHSELNSDLPSLISDLEKLIDLNPKVVGVGECGIDISDFSPKRSIEEQRKLFNLQIELALKKNLALVIHNRNADEMVIDILKSFSFNKLRGVAHCFSSDINIAKQFLDLNFYLSFSGMITYPSRSILRDVVKYVPDDRFLVETDAPWLPPQGHRGELNHPKYVRIIAEKVSQVKEKPYLDVASLSSANTCRLFNINL